MVVVGGLRAWWSGRVCEEVLWTDPLRIARQGDNAVTLSVCIHCSFLLRSVSFAPQPHHHHLFATIHAQTDSNTKCGSELHFCQMGPSSSSAIPLRSPLLPPPLPPSSIKHQQHPHNQRHNQHRHQIRNIQRKSFCQARRQARLMTLARKPKDPAQKRHLINFINFVYQLTPDVCWLLRPHSLTQGETWIFKSV